MRAPRWVILTALVIGSMVGSFFVWVALDTDHYTRNARTAIDASWLPGCPELAGDPWVAIDPADPRFQVIVDRTGHWIHLDDASLLVFDNSWRSQNGKPPTVDIPAIWVDRPGRELTPLSIDTACDITGGFRTAGKWWLIARDASQLQSWLVPVDPESLELGQSVACPRPTSEESETLALVHYSAVGPQLSGTYLLDRSATLFATTGKGNFPPAQLYSFDPQSRAFHQLPPTSAPFRSFHLAMPLDNRRIVIPFGSPKGGGEVIHLATGVVTDAADLPEVARLWEPLPPPATAFPPPPVGWTTTPHPEESHGPAAVRVVETEMYTEVPVRRRPGSRPLIVEIIQSYHDAFVYPSTRNAQGQPIQPYRRMYRTPEPGIMVRGGTGALATLPSDIAHPAQWTLETFNGLPTIRVVALDRDRSLLLPFVSPVPALSTDGSKVSILRLGTVRPPSTDVTWWGHVTLPPEAAPFEVLAWPHLEATDAGLLLQVRGFTRDAQNPRRDGYFLKRLAYPAEWPDGVRGPLGRRLRLPIPPSGQIEAPP